jgi:hypothetical protein
MIPSPDPWPDLAIYECWECDGELSFLPANHPQHELLTRGVYDEPMVHRYSVRAASWIEAMNAHHACQGWEPYRPMEET